MNKFIAISFLISLFALLSCQEDLPDFDAKRTNIVGTWQINQASQEIRADTLYQEFSSALEITFFEDGTGKRDNFLLEEEVFEWIYQFNPEKVVITSKTELNGLSNVTYFSVTKNEKDRQIWEWEVVPILGAVDKYKHTWKMDRQ